MTTAWWSKGKKDRCGVSSAKPTPKGIITDLLSLALMKRGARSEDTPVELHDFVPVRALVRLVGAFIKPSEKASPKSKKTMIGNAGKQILADFVPAKNKSGYYRKTAGKLLFLRSEIPQTLFVCQVRQEKSWFGSTRILKKDLRTST